MIRGLRWLFSDTPALVEQPRPGLGVELSAGRFTFYRHGETVLAVQGVGTFSADDRIAQVLVRSGHIHETGLGCYEPTWAGLLAMSPKVVREMTRTN